jgi:hypothetical protein
MIFVLHHPHGHPGFQEQSSAGMPRVVEAHLPGVASARCLPPWPRPSTPRSPGRWPAATASRPHLRGAARRARRRTRDRAARSPRPCHRVVLPRSVWLMRRATRELHQLTSSTSQCEPSRPVRLGSRVMRIECRPWRFSYQSIWPLAVGYRSVWLGRPSARSTSQASLPG